MNKYSFESIFNLEPMKFPIGNFDIAKVFHKHYTRGNHAIAYSKWKYYYDKNLNNKVNEDDFYQLFGFSYSKIKDLISWNIKDRTLAYELEGLGKGKFKQHRYPNLNKYIKEQWWKIRDGLISLEFKEESLYKSIFEGKLYDERPFIDAMAEVYKASNDNECWLKWKESIEDPIDCFFDLFILRAYQQVKIASYDSKEEKENTLEVILAVFLVYKTLKDEECVS